MCKKKIKGLEDNAQISGKYLGHIEAKNKQLENDLVNCKKNILRKASKNKDT